MKIYVVITFIGLLILSACAKEEDQVEPVSKVTGQEMETTKEAVEVVKPREEAKGSVGETAEPTEAATSKPDKRVSMALAKKSGCLACHSVDKKRIGPAWNDVSEKYMEDGNAHDKIVSAIKNGSKNAWGRSSSMPPQRRVSEEDASTLANFIIHLKK
jgi:cytochrome c